MKIDAKMDPKHDSKLDIWALKGQIFDIWRCFLRSQIFDGFLIGEKSAKSLKIGGLGRPRGECAQIWGQVGGQGGGHRRLLESDRNWQESDNAFRTPCTPKGGGGF